MAMRIVALKRNRKQTKADYQFIVLAKMYVFRKITISKEHRNPTSPYENWDLGIQFMVSLF